MQTTQETLTTAQNERLHTLLLRNGAGRPVLALHIGSQQDSGLQRKYRPNEDCLFVMHGTTPSPAPALLPTPFVLLVVADGMGGQGYGRTASRLAVQSLVAYISSSLSTQQIAAILTAPMPTPRDKAHVLIQAALAGGGADNVSAIVAEVSQIL